MRPHARRERCTNSVHASRHAKRNNGFAWCWQNHFARQVRDALGQPQGALLPVRRRWRIRKIFWYVLRICTKRAASSSSWRRWKRHAGNGTFDPEKFERNENEMRTRWERYFSFSYRLHIVLVLFHFLDEIVLSNCSSCCVLHFRWTALCSTQWMERSREIGTYTSSSKSYALFSNAAK